MRAELKRLHQQLGTTTIYVTHDQEEAMTLGDRVVVMCDGFIRQCDTPLDVYRRPRDRFVAGFLGTPPMNFLEGFLGTEGASVAFESGSGKIRLTAEQSSIVREHVGQPVILGIRPEALEFADGSDTTGEQLLSVTVDVVEPLGGSMDLYVRTTANERLTSRVPSREITPGQQIQLRVDAQRLHVFAPNEHESDPDRSTRYGSNLTLGEPVAARGE